jgi:hypothetical protein
MTTLAILNPIDPGTNARVTIRVCSSQDPAVTGAAGQRWIPAMSVQPILSMSFFDGDFSSSVTPAQARIALRLDVLQAIGSFPRAARYDWSGAFVSLYRLVSGSLVLLAEMQVRSFASEDGVLGLDLAVDDAPVRANVLFNEYAGTTGAEGAADLKGRPKPWAFGRCLNVEPVAINQIDSVFQVSGYGAVSAISAVYERGASFGASTGDFATYAALVAATIPPGRWATCLAQGMFRLGAPPAGVITCDVDGDTTSGFLRRTGAVVKEIARRLSLSAKVNAASFDALDAAVARNVNFYITDQITLIDFVQQVVAPCNAVAAINLDGRLIAPRVALGSTEAMTLDAQGRQMPPVLGMARQNTSPPYKRIRMGAARSWRVHTFEEIAFFADLIDRGAYDAAETYREGNLIELSDKSRWVYINPTASSGNAPPTWPTASNSFWENIAPPLAPADIGLEAGATRNVPRGTYNAGTTYVRGDSVLFSGSSYQLIVASSTGNAPPDALRWALLANAGSGPAGADGLAGISVIVSNEAHNVPTAADGSGGDYSTAGGQMRLLRGDVVLTPTFSVPAKTPNTSWISIDASTGVYTVNDPGVDLATATIRAVWAGVNYDRTYTLAKSKQGVTGPNLKLNESAQAFTFTDGVANPTSQTITLTAELTNLSGTATFTTTPSVTLGGTGNTRTLSIANFGNNRQVTVQATLGGITDRITLVRQDRDAFGGNANRVPFSRMEGNRGWKMAFNPSSLAFTEIYGAFGGLRFFATQFTATTSGQIGVISQQSAPGVGFTAAPGERLSVQARVTAQNVNAWTFNLWWVRSDGSRTQAGVASGSGAVDASSAIQRDFVTAPTDNPPVVGAYLEVVGASAAAGTMQLAIVDPMVTSAAADQTIHPSFSPGPNARDGADPNSDITVDGDGRLQGIGGGAGTEVSNGKITVDINGVLQGGGTAGVFVDNRRAALQGLASARPASGQFIGQEYHATDTREISQWDGMNWRASADITATAQRSIVPQFPVIEIKQGEAGHTGNRTVTHVAKRGTATLTGGTWSLLSETLGAGEAAINASTGTVTLSDIVQSGAYAIRYTHTDSLATDLAVNVTFIPTPPSGGGGAKTGTTTSNAGVGNTGAWTQVISLVLTGAPTPARVFFNDFGNRLSVSSGSGDCQHEARLVINGSVEMTEPAQSTVSGGLIQPIDFSNLFVGAHPVTGTTVTVAVEMRRTSGSGTIAEMLNELDVTVVAS